VTNPDEKDDVFISYNSKDVLAVDVLDLRLKACGIRCWRDEWKMSVGDDVVQCLGKAIQESSIVIAFVGGSGLGPWQKREIFSAQIEKRITKSKHILPVFFRGISSEEREKLADFLETRSGLVFRHLDEEEAFEKLLKPIHAKLLAEEPSREFFPCDDVAALWKELENPYKGLKNFSEGDWERFCGREKAMEELVERIESILSAPGKVRLLVLSGASGCGKSSLARAGLMARLKKKWGAPWRYKTIEHPSDNPVHTLATEVAGDGWKKFEAEVYDDIRALDRKMSQDIPGGVDGRFVLLVDQFEEVFTVCQDEKQRHAFLSNLLVAATKDNGKGMVILTLRSEFLKSFMEAVDDLEGEKKVCNGKAQRLKDRSIYNVTLMLKEELREAIEWPAKPLGVSYDETLLKELLDEAIFARKDQRAREGILPLLQVVLHELWQYRAPRRIRHEAYQTTGGIRGALEKQANKLYEELDESERHLAQHIFLNLLRMNPDAPETRQRVSVNGFSVQGHDKKEVEKVVQRLVDARLLVSDKEGKVEIIHEALIQHWSVLREWVESNREGLKRKQHIEDRAQRWKNGDDGDLLTDKALDAALKWVEEDAKSPVPLGLNKDAKEFLEASKNRPDESGLLRAALEQHQAKEQAHHLVSKSQDQRADVRLLLAMASIQEVEKTQTRALAASERALLDTFQAHPQLHSYLHGHTNPVKALTFSPDGKLLASASYDKTIQLWDVSRQSWRERARKTANRNMTLEEWRTHMGERPYRKIFEDLPGPSDAP